MTRLPRSPDSTLVLRLNQEIVHDFILPFLPPCGPHWTPLDTGSLEPSLLVFSTPGGLTGHDLSCLFFTCTNQSSHNLHLQYLARNQSTPRCQSLITPGSDHPSVLEPHRLSVVFLLSPFFCEESNYPKIEAIQTKAPFKKLCE
jgi:hypothetical protein